MLSQVHVSGRVTHKERAHFAGAAASTGFCVVVAPARPIAFGGLASSSLLLPLVLPLVTTSLLLCLLCLGFLGWHPRHRVGVRSASEFENT